MAATVMRMMLDVGGLCFGIAVLIDLCSQW